MTRNRGLLIGLAGLLVVALAVGLFVWWPGRGSHRVVALFSSTVGLYPGDEVRVVGVPVGKIENNIVRHEHRAKIGPRRPIGVVHLLVGQQHHRVQR